MTAGVTLTGLEVVLGAIVGTARHSSSVRANREDAHGFNGDNGLSCHILGASGELAVAKATGVYWNPSVGTFGNGADVGTWQVRTRSRHDYELIVRDNDRDEDIFVLVTGEPPYFDVRGWIVGLDCRRLEWRQAYGGRPPAFFVPQSALAPIDTLK